MFTPIYQLPQFSAERASKLEGRWREGEGPAIQDRIIAMIRAGGGSHLLQDDFEAGRLGFLESETDLGGMDIYDETIDFPTTDNFRALDLSYASLSHCVFTNACFLGSHLSFATLSYCEFHDCRFGHTGFFGARLQHVRFVDCDFVDLSHMTNCDLTDVSFEKCFFQECLFSDCRFDETTRVQDPLKKVFPTSQAQWRLDDAVLAAVFHEIEEAYRAGNAIGAARTYYFKRKQAATRYNTDGFWGKAKGYALEVLAGYGVRPWRTLVAMVIAFLVFSMAFASRFGPLKGVLLSAGAFFTFGAHSASLEGICPIWTLLYVVEAFLGVSLTALFITVLASYWFGRK